jgi:hypothetical protein
MADGQPTFERDVRPLFRPEDVDAMKFLFDLCSYEDCKKNAEEILMRLSDGSMPCDATWPKEKVDIVRRWIEAGARPPD